MRKTLFILFFLVLCSIGFAQDKITISGKVKDKNTNETLPMTPVQISELNVFTVTDMDGNFLFERIPVGTYTFKITSLGYQPLEKEMELTKTMSDMLFLLEVQNLTLDHVEVVAQRGNGMNSSSMVNTQAIEHVQASSLKDVMQLIPGAVTTNTDMSERNLITIRSLDNDVTNAMGTAIIMDGATLSNDMNMQLKGNGDVQVNELTNKTNSSAMAGADARQISTDNIESIEVIRGVPSAEYGNLTSGAVVVKSKAGQSPLEVRFKTDPKLKQVYAGKGVKLNGNSGILNVGADYTNSVRSLVSPVDAYNRFNLTTAYSKNLAKNLTFNARLLGDYSVLSAKTDPDNDNDEHSEETSKSLRLNINGMWTVNSTSPIFVDYLLYASVQEQDDYYHSFERFSARSYPVSKETGIYQGTYTSKDYYYSDLNINGLPLDFQAKMTGKMFSKFGIIDNKILAGFEFQSQGNKGKGKMFNPQKPPEGSAIRERSFKDIPFLNRLTLYAEDKVTVHLGQTFLDLQAGLRFNYILPDDKLKVNELSCLEPRLNVNWVVAQRNAGLKYLSFRGSWGVNNKMPTMAYLYPEIEYFDRQLFAYSDQDYNFNLFTTHKFENIVNENLKMPKSVKIEFGTDFHIYQINGSFAYYNEHLTNAYQFEKQFQSYALPMWQSTAYFGSGAKFSWDGNKLFQIDEGQPKLLDPMRTDTGFLDYDKSSNGGEIRTWGIEYTLDFGTIKAIKTQVHIDGAYISVSKTNSANVGEQVGNYETKNKVFGVAYYKGAASVANVTINDRLNTNIRFITHIPKLGIVTTLTVQAIWHEGMQQRSNLAYYVDGAVSPHKVNPDYYVDIYGTRHRFQAEWADPDYVPEWVTEADRDKYKNYYGDMIKAEPSNYFLYQRWSPYMLMNIRVTKEIKEKVTISFYANNFLNQEGNSKNSVTKISLKKNSSTPIYFGAEVKFKF